MKTSNWKGNIAQLKVALDLYNKGFTVFTPIDDYNPIDAITVDEKGKPEFTEAEIRQHFSKPLIDAVWAEILKKNFLGKATAKPNLNEKNSGQSLSSTALEAEPLPKPSEALVTENTSTGGSTESAEEA